MPALQLKPFQDVCDRNIENFITVRNLEVMKIFFAVMTVAHCNTSSKKAVQAPSLEVCPNNVV